MEESVALDSNKQKKFVKSVKGIKKLLKKQKPQNVEDIVTPPEVVVKEKKFKKLSSRGLVYLSHIPHGFYENEMSQYFRQFGMVTNVRVIRSKKTGNSKGFAFVEFKDTEVAQVVAETMNNYLMGKRLLKAVYIPPEKQKTNAKRMHWTPQDNPTANRRKLEKKKINAPKSEEADLNAARNMLKNLDATKGKLKEMGIDYDFFKPVDVPEGIDYKLENCNTDVKDKNIKKEESEDVKENVKVAYEDKKDVKKTDKMVKVTIDNKDLLLKKEKTKTGKKNHIVKEVKLKEFKKVKNDQKTDDEIQKNKKNKLEDLKVELLEDFIGIQDSDGDSDGSLEFDSDEFEKAMDEDSLGSDDESSDENSVLDESEESAEIVNEVKLPKGNTKPSLNKKSSKIEKQTKLAVVPKRKAEQKSAASKKAKFEKQNKNTVKKVTKKKK